MQPVLILLIALAGLSAGSVHKSFLLKQINILDLLNYQNYKLCEDDKITKTLDEFTSQIEVADFHSGANIDKFKTALRNGFLPKTKIFSLTFDKQRDEAVSLFNLLLNAKTYDIFYRTAVLARKYMNYGTFVYAFTLAVFHRPDCRGIITPQPYEIDPYNFVSYDVINKVKHIIEGNTNVDGVITSGNKYTIYNSLSDTNDININDQKLGYFTNDIGLNSFYYHYNLQYPCWLNNGAIEQDKRGELHYFVHQQLLAHYKLERLSNGLPSIPIFSWHKVIRNGFNPKTQNRNGVSTPARPNLYVVFNRYKILSVDDVEKYERNIRHSVQKGFIALHDGSVLSLKNPEDIETLGRLVQGKIESRQSNKSDYGVVIAKYLLGGSSAVQNKYDYVPSAIEQFQTTTRDPIFYQLWERYLQYYYHFKSNLPAYTTTDLSFSGITINYIKLTNLITYFEDYDFDITNCVDSIDATRKDKKVFFARQKRLNHEPFSVRIGFTSDKETDATIRIFLGPKFDNFEREIKLLDNWKNFVEIDNFVSKIHFGKNIIVRKDTEFIRSIGDPLATANYLNKIKQSLTENEEFHIDNRLTVNGWPLRLVLPKGKQGGLKLQVFVIISKFKPVDSRYGTGFPWQYSGTVTRDGRFSEDLAYGFPFDRPSVDDKFTTSNMKFTDVDVFHIQKITTNDVVSQFKKDHVKNDHTYINELLVTNKTMTYDDLKNDYNW